MDRVLTALTYAAFLALALGVADAPSDMALATLALGTVFTLLATVGFARVRRGGRPLAFGYVAIQLVLGFTTFAVGGELLGSTLLLLLLVSHSVQVLPLPWAAAVVAVMPLMHIGMSWWDGLREGLGTLIAAVFVAVLTEVTRRERQARAGPARPRRRPAIAGRARRTGSRDVRRRRANGARSHRREPRVGPRIEGACRAPWRPRGFRHHPGRWPHAAGHGARMTRMSRMISRSAGSARP